MKYRILGAAAGLIAATAFVSGAFAGDQPGVVSAGKLAKDAKKYYGQKVSVNAEVEDVLSPNAFTLDEDALFAGPDVLVLVPRAVADKLRHDQKVIVRGTVRPYIVAELDRDLEWFENGKIVTRKTDIDWEKRPVVVAEAVITPDGRDLLAVS